MFYIKWSYNILLIIFPCKMLGDLYAGSVKLLFSVSKVVLAKGDPPTYIQKDMYITYLNKN